MNIYLNLNLSLLIVSIVAITFTSCTAPQNPGNEILFADAIGNYEGICADFVDDIAVLSNEETASFNIYAANLEEAGISSSCMRIDDDVLSIKTATAAKIVFLKDIDMNTQVRMEYFAENDSIILTKIYSVGMNTNILFAGKRI